MDIDEELPEPWHWIESDESRQFVQQLERETGPTHVLFGRRAKTVARRFDCDDFLFHLIEGDSEFAVVHLTWSAVQHRDANWPRTQLFKDWEDVYTNRIVRDSKECEQ